MPNRILTRWGHWGVVLGLPGLAAGILWWTRPTPNILSQYSTSLQARSTAQRHNIVQAITALDGVYLQPGEVFSFNQTVGPRTSRRGYLPAPAFMVAETVDSVGGGICQVSSTLYNAALQAGLTIIERHAHFTPVQSVQPGLDATVWYGKADLRFQNPYPWPVQLQAVMLQGRLVVKIAGKQTPPGSEVRVEQSWLDPNHLQVNVFRANQRISQDVYVVNRSLDPR